MQLILVMSKMVMNRYADTRGGTNSQLYGGGVAALHEASPYLHVHHRTKTQQQEARIPTGVTLGSDPVQRLDVESASSQPMSRDDMSDASTNFFRNAEQRVVQQSRGREQHVLASGDIPQGSYSDTRSHATDEELRLPLKSRRSGANNGYHDDGIESATSSDNNYGRPQNGAYYASGPDQVRDIVPEREAPAAARRRAANHARAENYMNDLSNPSSSRTHSSYSRGGGGPASVSSRGSSAYNRDHGFTRGWGPPSNSSRGGYSASSRSTRSSVRSKSSHGSFGNGAKMRNSRQQQNVHRSSTNYRGGHNAASAGDNGSDDIRARDGDNDRNTFQMVPPAKTSVAQNKRSEIDRQLDSAMVRNDEIRYGDEDSVFNVPAQGVARRRTQADAARQRDSNQRRAEQLASSAGFVKSMYPDDFDNNAAEHTGGPPHKRKDHTYKYSPEAEEYIRQTRKTNSNEAVKAEQANAENQQLYRFLQGRAHTISQKGTIFPASEDFGAEWRESW